ncbi:hypothetical protein BS17DRAFT_777513 [Gyrodon lividus]|nr:hypothetical protein BS17DRAFT_777513 [Gyrodon lividus]
MTVSKFKSARTHSLLDLPIELQCHLLGFLPAQDIVRCVLSLGVVEISLYDTMGA